MTGGPLISTEPGCSQRRSVSVGLLGADFASENGRYRIKRIYTARIGTPDLRAPLSAPGIHGRRDYLLEVNAGRSCRPPISLQSVEGTAGHQTLIRVTKDPSMEGSRVVTVIPVPSEYGLRTGRGLKIIAGLVDNFSLGAGVCVAS